MEMLNALKTGDGRVDIITALCIPIVFKLVFQGISQLHQFRKFNAGLFGFFHSRFHHERFITYKLHETCGVRVRQRGTVIQKHSLDQSHSIVYTSQSKLEYSVGGRFDKYRRQFQSEGDCDEFYKTL
jgi:hypothetical protein